jgi:hypothetical protein
MTFPTKSAAERRAEITAAIRKETGIDEAMIERLVRSFYVRIGSDGQQLKWVAGARCHLYRARLPYFMGQRR